MKAAAVHGSRQFQLRLRESVVKFQLQFLMLSAIRQRHIGTRCHAGPTFGDPKVAQHSRVLLCSPAGPFFYKAIRAWCTLKQRFNELYTALLENGRELLQADTANHCIGCKHSNLASVGAAVPNRLCALNLTEFQQREAAKLKVVSLFVD